MKRRIIRPYKILAVTLGASAGCTTAPRPDPPTATTAPAITAPAIPAAPAPRDVRLPPPDDKVDRQLLTLRDELYRTGTNELGRTESHFRPLCDKDGYPLVGNLGQKSLPVAAFCEAQRAKKPL